MMFESIPDKIVCYRGVRIPCLKTSAADHAGAQFHRNCVRHCSSTIGNKDWHTTSHTTDGG